jgi:hypothetical protein
MNALFPAEGYLLALGSSYGVDVLGLNPGRQDFERMFASSIEDRFDQVAGRDFFRFSSGFLRDPYSGLGPGGRDALRGIRGDAGSSFLVDLIARYTAGGIPGTAGIGGIRDIPQGDLRAITRSSLLNGLATAGARGENVDALLATLVRALVPFEASLRLLNNSFLTRRDTTLRPGKTMEDLVARAAEVLDVYSRRILPPRVDAEAVVREVLESQGFLSRGAVARAARLASRDAAEDSGETLLDPQLLDEPERIGRRGGNKKQRERRRARREAIEEALGAGLDAVDEFERALKALRDPTQAVTQRFGEIQVAFDRINTIGIKDLQNLPQYVDDAIGAIQAWGQSISGQIDQLRDLEREMRASTLALGEEVDALRESTTTADRYTSVIAEQQATLRQLSTSGGSPAAQVSALRDLLDLFRAQARAEIQDLQDAAQDRGDAINDRLALIGPLGSLAPGIREQLAALQGPQFGQAPPAALAELGRQIGEAQARYQSATTGDVRANAASEIQRVIGQQLDLAGGFYGQGSSVFRALQSQSVGILRTLGIDATDAEQEALALQREQRTLDEETRDAVRAVQLDLADQLEVWGQQIAPLLQAQAAQIRTSLAGILPPGTDLDALLADPMAASILVANLQLKEMEKLNATLARFEQAAWGRSGPNTVDDPTITIADVPRLADGGYVRREGLAYVHADEYVIPSRKMPGPTVTLNVQPGAIVVQLPMGATPSDARLLGYTAADAFTARTLQVLRTYTHQTGRIG